MADEKKTEKTEVKTLSPEVMISNALAKGENLEQLEKLLQIKIEYEKNEARKAYHKAMAGFKANPPEINKDKKVGYKAGGGQVSYSHASLFNVTHKINKELSKYGLSSSWTTKQNGQIVVICKITHELGHSEETTLSAPSDTSGSKNPIQAIGSTITYLQRYTLLSLTGLATSDQDDDAQTIDVEVIVDKQLSELRDLLAAKEIPEAQLCKLMKVESLEALPENQFIKAKLMIKGAVKK